MIGWAKNSIPLELRRVHFRDRHMFAIPLVFEDSLGKDECKLVIVLVWRVCHQEKKWGLTNNNTRTNNPSQVSDLPKDEAILSAYVERSLRMTWRTIALEC